MIGRLKTNRVERWGATYLAGGWMSLQVVDVLGEGYAWSGSAIRVAASIVAMGLPLVLWYAWWQSKDEPRALRRGEATILVGLAFAAVGVGFIAPRYLEAPAVAEDTRSDERAASAGWVSDARAIAVLPFIDATGQPESYLAQGLHEEILLALSQVRGFRVTSRTSVARFAIDRQAPEEITRALDVGSLVTGSVRMAGDSIRVSIELVDPEGNVVWGNVYDRPPHDVFAIQIDVATEVARALEAVITGPEQRRIASLPTQNLAAYAHLQRARELIRRPGYEAEDLTAAADFLEQALDEDPSFGLAYAQLASVHVLMYRFAIDGSPERLAGIERALRRALALNPDLAEANVALGFKLYQIDRDYEGAEDAFLRARATTPSEARAIAGLGFVRRRQGRWEEAIEQFRSAAVVDPLNSDHWLALGTTFKGMRRYEAADMAYRRMQAIEPESPIPLLQLGHLRVDWLGDLKTLEDAVALARESGATGRRVEYADFRHRYLAGQYDAALRVLDAAGIASFDGSSVVRPTALLRAWTYVAAGEPELARQSFARARSILEARLASEGSDARILSALGLALAGLGEHDLAIRSAERATQMESSSENAMHGPRFTADLARVFTQVGETNRAVDLVDQLLREDGGLTPALLRLDPIWSPLATLPKFQRLSRGSGSGSRSG